MKDIYSIETNHFEEETRVTFREDADIPLF
jgi:hypothetical protein